MNILIIAMSESIHVARWIKQIEGQYWEIHLFPVFDSGKSHILIRHLKVHHSIFGKVTAFFRKIIPGKYTKYVEILFNLVAKANTKLFPESRESRLRRTIKKIKPDIVHTMETQNAGYLMLKVHKKIKNLKNLNYKWMHSNWGSDIYLFGRLPEHKFKIIDLLMEIDCYSCECKRDLRLAEKFGFKGKSYQLATNTGGFDLELAHELRTKVKTSKRKTIMLKGYQSWAGRALFGLRALERCVDVLKGYTIVSYSTIPDVDLALNLFSLKYKIPISILPNGTSHDKMLEYHSKARLSIGLSISDAVSTSFIEAIVMGSFPIQSFTSCADEWVIHGKTGFLVPPEDPDIIENCIRSALKDDILVDTAAIQNWKTVKKRLDLNLLRNQAIEIYQKLFSELNE